MNRATGEVFCQMTIPKMLKKMKERNQKAKELQQKLAHRVVTSVNPEYFLDYEEIPEGVKVPGFKC